MSISPRQINIQLAVSGCDVVVDVNIAISLQHQGRITALSFGYIRVNGDVTQLR